MQTLGWGLAGFDASPDARWPSSPVSRTRSGEEAPAVLLEMTSFSLPPSWEFRSLEGSLQISLLPCDAGFGFLALQDLCKDYIDLLFIFCDGVYAHIFSQLLHLALECHNQSILPTEEETTVPNLREGHQALLAASDLNSGILAQ